MVYFIANERSVNRNRTVNQIAGPYRNSVTGLQTLPIANTSSISRKLIMTLAAERSLCLTPTFIPDLLGGSLDVTTQRDCLRRPKRRKSRYATLLTFDAIDRAKRG